MELIYQNETFYVLLEEKLDHQEYWQRKRERNIQHDHEITARFEARGWTVIRIWECELKKKNEKGKIREIMEKIKSAQVEHE